MRRWLRPSSLSPVISARLVTLANDAEVRFDRAVMGAALMGSSLFGDGADGKRYAVSDGKGRLKFTGWLAGSIFNHFLHLFDGC
jgi:hypothetical protein